jgi:CDP-diglyceride synthetase
MNRTGMDAAQDALTQALILSLPLVVSGGLHMAVVKLDLLSGLKVPIARRWFGANKTWRGVVVMSVATVFGVWLTASVWPDQFQAWSATTLGVLLGLGYVAAELPNSFIKRRLGIEPGKRPAQHRLWFTLADQADSAIGCALVYAWTLRLSAATLLILVALGPAIHLVVNYTLYLMHLRREPV